MKPRKPDETDAAYIARLEASNADLRSQGKWAERVSRAVTALAVEASVAFQAMAEKAGVRSHPSVTEAVRLFDAIAHPQWTPDGESFNGITFPSDWDLDPPGAWSGDADMELNSPIAAVLEYLDAKAFSSSVKRDEREHVGRLMEGLDRPLQGMVVKLLPDRQRPPVDIPADASREDLAEAINAMSWAALDLAQDMASTNEMLRRDLRAAAYRRIARDLYEMARVHVPQPEHGGPFLDVKVIGGEQVPF